jgi:hypothetical protein
MTTRRLLPLALLPSFALALAACGTSAPTPASWGTPPDQLEAITLSGVAQGTAVSQNGAITVTGSGQDFSLSFAGVAPMNVHTPGKSDLSSLNGSTVTLDVPVGEAADPTLRSFVVTDTKGPVYVANIGYGVDTDTLFGAGFATYGAPVASEIIDLHAVSGYEQKDYTPIVFKTDTGDVSVLPGEVASITVKGAIYRVTTISSTHITYQTSQDFACGESSTMAYEMLRVETAPAPLKLVRPAGLSPLALGCGGI